MDDDGFILVSSKKGKGKSKTNKTRISTNKDIRINLKNEETNTLIDEKGFCEKLQREEIELRHSEFFTKFTSDALELHGLVVSQPKTKTFSTSNVISKIVCLGLGNFTSSKQGEYQLVFLKCLVNVLGLDDIKLKERVEVFDPVHTKSEENIIERLGFKSISKDHNSEGKYALKDKAYSATLFYLPHCPKQLTNNILWANWNPESLGSTLDARTKISHQEAHGTYILGNSFERITSSLPDRILKESSKYILLSSKFVFETKVENCFKYSDIFNDSSLHSFPINILPNSFDPVWKVATEEGQPIYKEDLEFIQDKF